MATTISHTVNKKTKGITKCYEYHKQKIPVISMAVWLFDFGALKIPEPNSAPATKVKKIKTFFAISPKTLRKGCTKCKLRI